MGDYEQFKKEMDKKAFRQSIPQTIRGIGKGQKKISKSLKGTIKKVGVKSGISIRTRPLKRTSSALLSFFTPKYSNPQSKGQVGRPKGIYKNPIGVPAQEWYKIQRRLRTQARIRAERVALQVQQQLAKRGLTPEQIQIIQQQRMQQTPQPPPQTPTPVQQPQTIWNRRGYLAEETDLMGNRKIVVRGRPESFWN